MYKKIIIGITAFNHDSSACIIADGKLLAFSEEERFNGVKHTSAFPSQSINYCLKEAGVTTSDITDVAFYFDIKSCILAYLKNNNILNYLIHPSLLFRTRYYYELVWLTNFINQALSIKKLLNNEKIKVHYIKHHIAHVWYGYYSSRFDNCVVISNDSVGEDVSTLAMQFEKIGNNIKTKEIICQYDPHSLGYLYGALTEFLGFKRGEGEGRVMALASFGTDRFDKYFEKNISLLQKGKFSLKNNLIISRTFQPKGQRLSNAALKIFGKPRSADSSIDQRIYDISHGLQTAFQRILEHQIKYMTKFSNNIVIVGGTAQNSVTNGILKDNNPDIHFHIPPIPHDAGCSIGAAIYVYYNELGKLPELTETAFLGPGYSDNEIINILTNNKIKFDILKTPIDFINKELINNKIIGFFRGRMECGPRALCNRTILANPCIRETKDYLNTKVKFREEFRPYGGFITEKNLKKLVFHKNKFSDEPYMSYVYKLRPNMINIIPSLVHIDQTCRVQTTYNDDVFLNKLLEKFERDTGSPIIINTSLNLRGYPIVRSPSEAIQTFYSCAMDHMIFNEKILITK